jgi:hypothetical protein
MIFSMSLYYNLCFLLQLGHKLLSKMYTNVLKTIFLLLVYTSFQPFVAAFQQIQSPKCTKFF